MSDPRKIYLHAPASALTAGDVTEHTHHPALKAFLEALEPGVTANRIYWRIYANY